MISSMTGYGRVNKIIENQDITVEIKSVNHRFFDFSLRTSRGYSFLEEKIKSEISKEVTRGKVDAYISIINNEPESVEVELDTALMSGYLKAFKNIEKEYNIENNLTGNSLLKINELFKVKKQEVDADKEYKKVKIVVNECIKAFIDMRKKEGEVLKKDVLLCLKEITKLSNEIEQYYPEIVEQYTKRLTEKIQKTLQDTNIDSTRILTEAAIFADKTAVNEEVVRLSSHIGQMENMLCENGPIGKKLDFLVQEMNREVNTIGSKANDLKLTKIVVELKSQIERIREQIQNIE